MKMGVLMELKVTRVFATCTLILSAIFFLVSNVKEFWSLEQVDDFSSGYQRTAEIGLWKRCSNERQNIQSRFVHTCMDWGDGDLFVSGTPDFISVPRGLHTFCVVVIWLDAIAAVIVLFFFRSIRFRVTIGPVITPALLACTCGMIVFTVLMKDEDKFKDHEYAWAYWFSWIAYGFGATAAVVSWFDKEPGPAQSPGYQVASKNGVA